MLLSFALTGAHGALWFEVVLPDLFYNMYGVLGLPHHKMEGLNTFPIRNNAVSVVGRGRLSAVAPLRGAIQSNLL